MRTILLMSAMLLALAAPPCLAQSQDGAALAATADAAPRSPAQPASAAAEPKSTFWRVMAVLIAKLVQDSRHRSHPPGTANGNATALPIDIDVGPAFRPDAAAATVAIKGDAATNGDAPVPPVAPSRGSGANDATSQPSEPLALEAALPADGP